MHAISVGQGRPGSVVVVSVSAVVRAVTTAMISADLIAEEARRAVAERRSMSA